MAEVKISGLHKRFGSFHAVRGIDLSIADGEFTVLVGPSGCGKSTLLRTIAGLEEISDGTIEIAGEVVNDMRPRDRDVAMVFQDYALYPHMTVDKNIGFGLRARKMPARRDRATRRRCGADARHHGAARALSAPALRRPAPARRHRPGDRARAAALPLRRALVESRRAASRRDARRDQAPAPGDLDDDDLRHPRPDRGDDAGRPHRPDARRGDRAGRLAGRAVRAAGLALRRRLPGLAEDELRAGRGAGRAPSSSRASPPAWRCRAGAAARRASASSSASGRSIWGGRTARPRRRARHASTRRSSYCSRPARAPSPPSGSARRRSSPSCRRMMRAASARPSRSTSTSIAARSSTRRRSGRFRLAAFH